MAQPFVVTAVTTAGVAALGPIEDHGVGHTAEGQVLSRSPEAGPILV
jgi:hypothetical protein